MAKHKMNAQTEGDDEDFIVDHEDSDEQVTSAPSARGLKITNMSGHDAYKHTIDSVTGSKLGSRFLSGNVVKASKQAHYLSAEEELRLARRLREHDDQDAAQQLALSHMRLAVSMARAISNGTDDAIQHAVLGLLEAISRFDPERGLRLSSYAVYFIKAELMTLVLKRVRVVHGVASSKPRRKIFFNLRSLSASLRGQGSSRYNQDRHIADPARALLGDDRSLSSAEISEIAQRLGVTEDDVRDVELECAPRRDVPLSELDDFDEPASNQDEPSARLAKKHRSWLATQGVRLAMESLPERDRDIIESRWIRANDNNAQIPTLGELGERWGISSERVRQIEASAMGKMRKVMSGQGFRQAIS